MPDEWEIVRRALRNSGVASVDDFGRFVNNTTYLRPSHLDEAAAALVFLDLLPMLEDGRVVATIARHLQSKAVGRGCYPLVLDAYRKWGLREGETGWVLGDTLARKSDRSKAQEFVALATDDAFGSSRAFIVAALWRFKSVVDTEGVLRSLTRDPSVSPYAMSALQRTIGAERMTDVLHELLDEAPEGPVAANARRQAKRVERKLGERGSHSGCAGTPDPPVRPGPMVRLDRSVTSRRSDPVWVRQAPGALAPCHHRQYRPVSSGLAAEVIAAKMGA